MLAVPAASATTTPTHPANPDLVSKCGLNISLIIDRSGSIGGNNVAVQQASQAMIDALAGTGSKVQVASFSTTATALKADGTNSALLADMSFRDAATVTMPAFTSSGTTNWDDGLEMVRHSPAGTAPITIMVTDGDPNRHLTGQPDGHGTALLGSGGATAQADVDAAVTEADLLKSAGSHMFVIGTGSALSNVASETRIKAISGNDKLTFNGSGEPSIPFGTADYTLVTDYSKLKLTFQGFVRQLCGSTLNITKWIQPANGGQPVKAAAGTPFTFDATVSPAPTWVTPVGGSGTTATLATDANGSAKFKWQTGQDEALSASEHDPGAGYVFNGVHCTRSDLDGSGVTELVNTAGLNAVGAQVSSRSFSLGTVKNFQSVSCDVFNRQLHTSTVSVQKATSPHGRPEAFGFAIKSGGATVGTATGLKDGDAPKSFGSFLPGTYVVSETAQDHFTTTAATCDNLSTAAVVENVLPSALAIGEQQSWLCTFTNTAENGTITIVKHLASAPAGSFGFTSNIPGHSAFSLSPAGGVDASTAAFSVVPGTYSVSETSPAPFTLSGATCTDQSTTGAITVAPGENVVCTFTNTAPAPTIDVTKSAGQSTIAEPGGNVAYTISVHNSSPVPLTISEVTDQVGGTTINVLTQAGCTGLLNAALAVGETKSCTFSAAVAGTTGAVVTDTVTAKAIDGYGHTATDDASASVTLTNVAPAITVTKSAAPSTIAEPGGPITYTVSVHNSSTFETVTLTELKDSLNGGPAINVAAVSPPVLATTCALGTIAPSATYTCTFTIPVAGNAGSAAGTEVPDTVTAKGVDPQQTVVQGSADAVVKITDAKPTIAVTKVAATTQVDEPGGNVSFTVGITNHSVEPVVLTALTDMVGIVATDVFAVPGSTCTPYLNTTIAPGATVTCSFTAAVVGGGGTSVTDTVTAVTHDDEGNEASGNATATVRVRDVLPTLDVTKTALQLSVPEPGGSVQYRVDVTNTSIEPITILSLLDSVAGGLGIDVATLPTNTCAALVNTSLIPGGSTVCTFTLPVSGNAGSSVTDVVTVTANDNEGNAATDTDDATVQITDVKPAITVTKTAGVASVPEPGANVTYTVVVHNGSAAESITISDLNDVVAGGAPTDVTTIAGTTCALPHTIAASGSYTCTFTVAVLGDHSTTPSVTDVVTATGHDDEGNETTGSGLETVAITDVAPHITVTKTAGVPSVPEPGGMVTYSVAVHNDSTAEAVVLDSLSDVVGADPAFAVTAVPGTTCSVPQTIAIDGTYTCQFAVAVTGDAGAVVGDTVTAHGHDNEGHDTSGDGSDTVDITDVNPLITVTKTASPSAVPEPGANVTYTVLVHNASPEGVVLNALSDVVGGGESFPLSGVAGTTCSVPQSIVSGGDYSCTFTQLVAGNAGDVVSDTVTAGATDNEDNPTTAHGSAAVDVTDVPPTGTLTKTPSTDTVPEPGGPVTFTVDVHNTSPESVTMTDLTDAVGTGEPFDITHVAGPVTATTCAAPQAIAADETYSCTFALVVSGNAGANVSDAVRATLTDDEDGSTTVTDTATVTVTDVLPTISVTKANDGAPISAPGGAELFTVTVSNTSPEPVTIDAITDTVEGVTFDVTHAAGLLTATDCATGGVLGAAGADDSTYTCHFTLVVVSNEPTVQADVVHVVAHDDEVNDATADAGASTTIAGVADLGITKTVTADLVAGGTGAYALTVTNAGPSTALTVIIGDVLPNGLTAATAVGDGWVCAIGADARSVVCQRDSLAPGASAAVTIQVTVAADLAGTQVTNTGGVGSTTTDPNPANNTASVTSTPTAPADVLGEVFQRDPLARTGTELRGWLIAAAALLQLGVAFLLLSSGLPVLKARSVE